MNEIEMAKARASRWKGQPPGAEAEYEHRCAWWESLTERQVLGLDPLPPYVPLAAPETAS